MENNYYSLGSNETNRFVKSLQVVFGILCIAIAVYWMIFNVKTIKSDGTLWITIIFLTGFGGYQIWSGAGKGTRYIKINHNRIQLKKEAILPSVQIQSDDIEKVDFYPLSVIFHLKSKKKVLLRFGTVHYETNGRIVDALVRFAETNNIPFEVIEEKI
jgi:hypothetical protein